MRTNVGHLLDLEGESGILERLLHLVAAKVAWTAQENESVAVHAYPGGTAREVRTEVAAVAGGRAVAFS